MNAKENLFCRLIDQQDEINLYNLIRKKNSEDNNHVIGKRSHSIELGRDKMGDENQISQRCMNINFRIAVRSQNLYMMWILLKPLLVKSRYDGPWYLNQWITVQTQFFNHPKNELEHQIHPSLDVINEVFKSVCEEGIDIEIIFLLQHCVQPFQLAEQFRYADFLHSNQMTMIDKMNHYLVGPTEEDHLKQIQSVRITYEHQLETLKGSSKYQIILKSQSWINEELLEACKNNQKFIVERLLSYHGVIQPSQYAINESFGLTIRYHNKSLAMLLGTYGVFRCRMVDQSGFNQALQHAIEQDDRDMILWLLTGQLGFCLLHSPLLHDYYVQLMEPFHDTNVIKDEMILTMEHFIHPDILQSTHQDLRRRGKISRNNENNRKNRYMFSSNGGVDIHGYSAATIRSTTIDPIRNPDPNNETSTIQNNNEIIPNGPLPPRIQPTTHTRNDPRRLTLNQAILQHIEQRIHRIIPTVPFTVDSNRINQQLLLLIEQHVPPSDQERAIHLISSLLIQEALGIFGRTLLFLSLITPPEAASAATHIWIQGFLSESILVNSCNPGALERVVTGLRGINDRELDEIFAQAEGPHLLRTFLSARFNLFYAESTVQFDGSHCANHPEKERAIQNAKNLAKEVVNRGVKTSTDEEQIMKVLKEYARESTGQSRGTSSSSSSIVTRTEWLLSDELEKMIESYVVVILDSYDTHLQPYVDEEILLLQSSQTESSSDAMKLDEGSVNGFEA